MRRSLSFVLCIEANAILHQSLLLVESIRTFGGGLAGAEVLAVAPRAGLGVDRATRARLAALGATYHEADLNTVLPDYVSANRVAAAAWAARHSDAETLVLLDSDTLLLGEPEIPAECDLAVRPVDQHERTSAGADDPRDAYWRALCELAGIAVDALPMVETVLDRHRVRASYNGGYTVVRRASGILERTAELFARSVAAGISPVVPDGGDRIRASTGNVSPTSSRWWGSAQAALAVAAAAAGARVRLLDRRYNVPLHGLAEPGRWSAEWEGVRPVHVHYHWMLDGAHRDAALSLLSRLGVARSPREWIAERTPLGHAASQAPRPTSAAAPRPLVILGMHRSATSLVSSALQAAGLDIGSRLEGAGPGNPRGHFEDSAFHELHERMLVAAGATPFRFDDEALRTAGTQFRREAQALVAGRAAAAGPRPWGWKDPRTCLFLDLWEEILPEARYLVLFRHPIDVALSLWRRGTDTELHSDPWLAILAWKAYNRRLLALCERHPERCFVAHVPAVGADLPGAVRRLAERFALPLAAERAARSFASGELAPHSPALDRHWQAVAPDAFWLYERLDALADVPSSAALTETSPGVPEPSAEALILALLDVRATLAAHDEERSGLAAALESGRARNESLARALAETRRALADLERRHAEVIDTLGQIESSRAYGLVRWLWSLRGNGARGPRADEPS